MATIDFVTVEAPNLEAVRSFYTVLGLADRVRVRASDAPTNGFRGFTLSLVTSQPANVDTLIGSALDAGAISLQPPAKSLWGYGAVVQAPDGTICTVASSSKKNTSAASAQFDDFVLQLGVEDVAASKQFYVDRGFEVSKSFGRKYVEFDTGRVVQLTLNSRSALAKTAGVPADGTGSHRLTLNSSAGPFTDPDGFVTEPTDS